MVSGSETKSEETQLITRLRFIEDDPSGHYVVHIHLSGLRASTRKPHIINIAATTFDNLLSNFEVALFKLNNADLVLLCKDVPVEEIDPPMHKLRQLFSEDPLTDSEDGAIDDHFSTWYDLVQQSDFTSFTENVELLAEQAIEQIRKASKLLSSNSLPGQDMRPADITDIMLQLQTVEIEDLIHSQTAIVIEPGGKGRILFREQFVSMSALQKRIAPDINLFSSSWLFQYLTETIDRRSLGVVGKRDFESLMDPISINLNISTVLGREFQHFHQKAGAYSSKIIIELQLIDIFSGMAAYTDARDMLQENGYRVLVDGLSPLTVQFFDPALLEADLVKVNWGPEFINEDSASRVDEISKIVKNVGQESVILGRVDTEEAISWALGLGISNFQGFYVDTVADKMLAKGVI